jgi:hypothetical protein
MLVVTTIVILAGSTTAGISTTVNNVKTAAAAAAVVSNNNNNSSSSNNITSRNYYDQAGPIPDPNDPTHFKAQQLVTENGLYASPGSDKCDKGKGDPLCYNVGYYSGVIEAIFENNHNIANKKYPDVARILYTLGCPSAPANYCNGYNQGYSHTFTGHITNESEIWNAGYREGYGNAFNVSPETPMKNGTNPASCTEGPAAYCDAYAQAYPHGMEYALGRVR